MNHGTNAGFVLKQGMMDHQSLVLFHERNGETSAQEQTHSREPIAKPQDTNTNLIKSRLVHEISIKALIGNTLLTIINHNYSNN